jgi:hypothetical protein
MWCYAPGTNAISWDAEQTVSWKYEQRDAQFSWHVSAGGARNGATNAHCEP